MYTTNLEILKQPFSVFAKTLEREVLNIFLTIDGVVESGYLLSEWSLAGKAVPLK